MKFHELVAEHNIDYKFHDFEDLHPVYLRTASEETIPEFPKDEPQTIDEVIKTTEEAMLAVPILGSSAQQAINVAEESFNDLKDSAEAKLLFTTSVVEALEKGAAMRMSDLRDISIKVLNHVDVERRNFENTKTWSELIRDNIKLIKDLVIRFFNRVRNSGSFYEAIVEIVSGLLSAIKSVAKMIYSNRGFILKIVLVVCLIVGAFRGASANNQSVMEYIQDFLSNIINFGVSNTVWLCKLLLGYKVELRDTLLGAYKLRNETKAIELMTELTAYNTKVDATAVGAGVSYLGGVAITGSAILAKGSGAAAATGPYGWTLWGVAAAVVGAIGFIDYATKAYFINPEISEDILAIDSSLGVGSEVPIMRSYEYEVHKFGQQMLSEQREAAFSAVSSWMTPATLMSIFSTIIVTSNHLLQLKMSKKDIERRAGQAASLGGEVIRIQGNLLKAKVEVNKMYVRTLDTQRKLRTGLVNAGLVQVDAFCNEINNKIDNKYKLRTESIKNKVDAAQQDIQMVTNGAKMYAAKVDFKIFERYLKANQHKDGTIEPELIEEYVKNGYGFDYKHLLEEAYDKAETKARKTLRKDLARSMGFNHLPLIVAHSSRGAQNLPVAQAFEVQLRF